MVQRPRRPIGITILAVLEILIGIVGLLASLAIIGFSALFSTLPRIGSLLGANGLIIGGVVLFFSLIWLATGAGFLHGRGWSWTLGMIFSILSLLGALGALTIGLITGGVGGLIFWGLMMYYLTRTRVKAFFGKGGLPISPSYGLPYSLVPQVNQPQIATTNTASYGKPAALGPPPFHRSRKKHQPVFLCPAMSRQPHHPAPQAAKPQSVHSVTAHSLREQENALLAAQLSERSLSLQTTGNVRVYPSIVFSAIPSAETVGEWMILPVHKR